MARSLAAIAVGFLAGALLGVLGVVVFVAAWIGDDYRRGFDATDSPSYRTQVWMALSRREALPYWSFVAAAAAANGAIGGWAGYCGRRRAWPVAGVSLGLLAYPAYLCARGDDAKGWVPVLIGVVFVGLFVWVAGRVAQELGWRLRPAEPGAAADGPRL